MVISLIFLVIGIGSALLFIISIIEIIVGIIRGLIKNNWSLLKRGLIVLFIAVVLGLGSRIVWSAFMFSGLSSSPINFGGM